MHKRFTQLSLAVLLAGGVPLLAQNPSQPPGQPPQTPPATQRPTTEQPTSTMVAGAETTLTGCVRTQRADAGSADTKGNIYTLELSSGAGRGEGAASGGTAATGAARAAATAEMTYTIAAPESVAIGKHVGHQVELTGRVQPAMGSRGAAAGVGAATATKPEPGGAHRTFQATALKMISAKCP